MKIARKKRGRIFKEMRIYFIVILLLAVLGAAFHAVLRQALLKNFQEVGTALARSYVSEESNNLTVYETLLNFGAESINVRIQEGRTADEIEEWLGMYYERLQTVLGKKRLTPMQCWMDGSLRQIPGKGILHMISAPQIGIRAHWLPTAKSFSPMRILTQSPGVR